MTERTESRDRRFMQAALALARRGLGQAWPNPTVGCVLVRHDGDGDTVVGRGWTGDGGRPHGETLAIGRAGDAARGATAYVSLEPCSHHGQTPPCAGALIAAGVARCVLPVEDPDPRVSGRGIASLRAAGIETVVGVGAAAARALNEGFFLRILEGRPLVTLKMATSLDGRIATRTGASQWISGETARRHAHMMRASHDAILVGIGTALADDPRLTCRLPGMADRSPVRVVLDSGLRLPPDGRLAGSARETPLYVIGSEGADAARREALVAAGARVILVPSGPDGRPGPLAALEALAGEGITRVLVEGGAGVAGSLFRDDLVDRIVCARAPLVIGGDGLPVAGGWGVGALADARRYRRSETRRAGPDLIETLRRVREE